MLLFDWYEGGHHGTYLARIAEALVTDDVRVVIAAPNSAYPAGLNGRVEFIGLGDPRPSVDTSRHFSREVRRLARLELEMMDAAVRQTRAKHVLHAFADNVLIALAGRRPRGVPTSVLLFRPRLHYPSLYGTPLSSREWMSARAHEFIVQRWRRHADSAVVLTLDEGAATSWRKHRGAHVEWMPEPPVQAASPEIPVSMRRGAVLYGSLGPRKGLDHVARALESRASTAELMLAGAPHDGGEAFVLEQIETMRNRGVSVSADLTLHSESEALKVLAKARCALLPYTAHWGMSRVLLEAAHARTPIVATRDGLIGHLVRKHALGRTVDVTEPDSFGEAIELTSAADAYNHYATNLAAFTTAYSENAFQSAIRTVAEYPITTPRSSSDERQLRPVNLRSSS